MYIKFINSLQLGSLLCSFKSQTNSFYDLIDHVIAFLILEFDLKFKSEIITFNMDEFALGMVARDEPMGFDDAEERRTIMSEEFDPKLREGVINMKNDKVFSYIKES